VKRRRRNKRLAKKNKVKDYGVEVEERIEE
jgi:hypothetical protein